MVKRIRGLSHLLFDAVEGTTSLVQRTHERATRRPRAALRQIEGVAETSEVIFATERVASRAVYASIRLVNRGLRELAELGFASTGAGEKTIEVRPATPVWDQIQGAINGVFGDYLHDRGNGYASEMSLHQQGQELAPEQLSEAIDSPSGKLAIFVHGLSCTEWHWSVYSERFYERPGVSYGSRLSEDLDYTPLFLRYNSGRHISQNGQLLSALLQRVVEHYPVPVEELVLIGHSMGGLVARSAAHYGAEGEMAWVDPLKHVFCIGSPNQGAPLEKAANAVTTVLSQFDVAGTQVPAELLNIRSAGIKDLRYGYTRDEEWLGSDPDAFWENNSQQIRLLDQVGYYAIGGGLGGHAEHPVTGLIGDIMVRLPSVYGEHREQNLRIPFEMKGYLPKVHHLMLMNHPAVYEQIRDWLESTPE